jgi:hypothetical protein
MDRSARAVSYIVNCCPTIGRYAGMTNVYGFLQETAAEMSQTKASEVFPDRYIEHVAYAMSLVSSNLFTSPPAAVASVYLANRFEFYFRMISKKLHPDGTWISSMEQAASKSEIEDDRLNKKRISSVALAYRIMKLNKSHGAVQHFIALDNAIHSVPYKTMTGFKIECIGDRIEFSRHAVGHGHSGDISSEGVFHGLVTALIFHSLTSKS